MSATAVRFAREATTTQTVSSCRLSLSLNLPSTTLICVFQHNESPFDPVHASTRAESCREGTIKPRYQPIRFAMAPPAGSTLAPGEHRDRERRNGSHLDRHFTLIVHNRENAL
jgi:hypothetical protein